MSLAYESQEYCKKMGLPIEKCFFVIFFGYDSFVPKRKVCFTTLGFLLWEEMRGKYYEITGISVNSFKAKLINKLELEG